MGSKGYRLWAMGQLDSNVQSPTAVQHLRHRLHPQGVARAEVLAVAKRTLRNTQPSHWLTYTSFSLLIGRLPYSSQSDEEEVELVAVAMQVEGDEPSHWLTCTSFSLLVGRHTFQPIRRGVGGGQ
jgi:hypothetical protein